MSYPGQIFEDPEYYNEDPYNEQPTDGDVEDEEVYSPYNGA
jgi:hypothetical protein